MTCIDQPPNVVNGTDPLADMLEFELFVLADSAVVELENLALRSLFPRAATRILVLRISDIWRN